MNLRTVRRDAGLSLAKAARTVGTSEGNLSRIERGHTNPSARMVASLLRTYGRDQMADELSALLDPA